MSSANPPPSNFPASMGPGGQPKQPQKDVQSMIAEITEMRKNYTVEVEPNILRVGYLLNGARRNYDINWDSAPLSGFQKWLCYGGRGRAVVSGTFLLDMLRGAENMTGRPMSQKEAEAFTRYSAKRMAYGFMGTVIALGSGYALAWRGAKKMKFPFKKPKPLESYDAFPLRRMPLLTGTYARSAWQVTRANIYAALGLIFLSPLFRGMGESVMAVGLYRDDRTRETVKDMKGGFDRIRMNRGSSSSRSVPVSQNQEASGGSEATDSADFYDRGGSQMQSYYGRSTDYTGDSTFSSDTTDTGPLSDSAMRKQEAEQSASTTYDNNRYSQRSTKSQASSSKDFFFDDASPTAGNESDEAAVQQNSKSAGSGNVWASIRRGGQSQSASAPSKRTSDQGGGWKGTGSQETVNDNATKGDSFSFSSSDSNRALAKEQAQKEFDAMLDKERRESGSGEYDRGSFAAEPGNETSQTSDGSVWERRRRGN